MTAEASVLPGSRAVLIGVSDYAHPEFPPIRAARNSVQAMRALLADSALCGWPPGLVTVIENPASAADLAGQVADLAESTTGVLLVYYVGHGTLSAQGELCLTVTSTRPDLPKFSGLPWEHLADILRACPARARLVILDCCFAGQAIEALGGDGDPGLAGITHIKGVYTLTATTRNRTAHVPPPGQQDTACTSFTSELRDLVRSGIPGKPPWLTFGDIYPVLRQRLRAKGLPAPNQQVTDTAYQFPFTANAAARADPDARSTQADGNGTVAGAMAATDPFTRNAAAGIAGPAPSPATGPAALATASAHAEIPESAEKTSGPSREEISVLLWLQLLTKALRVFTAVIFGILIIFVVTGPYYMILTTAPAKGFFLSFASNDHTTSGIAISAIYLAAGFIILAVLVARVLRPRPDSDDAVALTPVTLFSGAVVGAAGVTIDGVAELVPPHTTTGTVYFATVLTAEIVAAAVFSAQLARRRRSRPPSASSVTRFGS